MATKELDLAELTALVENLAALHAWEQVHMPFMQTTTGRHLYYMVAKRAIGERSQLDRSLKNLFGSPHFTERALRNRMQEMVEQGFFDTYQSQLDGRNKHLIPTEKFYKMVYEHSEEARRIFRGKFLMIPR